MVEAGKAEEALLSKRIDKSCLPGDRAPQSHPQIYQQGTNWQPARMLTVEEYCRRLDSKKPDFMAQMLKENRCRPGLVDESELDLEEKQAYARLVRAYDDSYREGYLNIF